ncbi:hypothetical protein ACMAZH_06745 [Arenicellales bacterium nBUS_45]
MKKNGFTATLDAVDHLIDTPRKAGETRPEDILAPQVTQIAR